MTETIVAILIVLLVLLTFPALFRTLGAVIWIPIVAGVLSNVVIGGFGYVNAGFLCVGLLVLVGCGLVCWSFRRNELARLAAAAREKTPWWSPPR
jgi:hypothetical protein